MYDRQTESWFQQYDGTGLFGQLAGKRLTALPARLESVGAVRARGGDSAWALDSLREKRRIETENLVLEWIPGRASALDSRKIADGRDLGIVTVNKKNADGSTELAACKISFAFVWHAFNPEAEIIR